jgi:hypothetical protein
MDQLPSQTPAPYQYTPPTTKKGLGTGAKVGIGCGVIVLLAIIGLVIAGLVLGPKLKGYVEDATKNPPRTAANMAVSITGGKLKLVAEDDVKQHYTVKDESCDTLMTFYLDERTKTVKTVTGDFSAIPAPGGTPPAEIAPTPDNATEEP